MKNETRNDFESASQAKQASLVREFWLFLKSNKKFWMIPLVLTLLVLAALVLLGGTAIAPFIYTLF